VKCGIAAFMGGGAVDAVGVIAGHRPGRTTRAPTTLNLNFVEDARARPSNGVIIGTVLCFLRHVRIAAVVAAAFRLQQTMSVKMLKKAATSRHQKSSSETAVSSPRR
jgi:hypothetical protein